MAKQQKKQKTEGSYNTQQQFPSGSVYVVFCDDDDRFGFCKRKMIVCGVDRVVFGESGFRVRTRKKLGWAYSGLPTPISLGSPNL